MIPKLSLLTLLFSTVLFLGGCKKDPCKDVTCLNGATCADGTCICPSGFTGANCGTPIDPCANVSCLNGGTCANGSCNCPLGYEGDDCGIETRAKFFGTYNVNESCNTTGNFNYQMSITSSSVGPTSVIINNFGGGVSVSATTSDNTLTIPTQQVTYQGTALTINGSGQLSGNILTLSYTVSGPGGSSTCTATANKL